MRPRTHFLQCCFSMFFESSFFLILWDLGCPEAPFWEAFWITFLAEARKRKSVFGLHRRVRIAYPAFRKMHFFSQLFPSLFLKHCAGGHFSRFVRFFALLRLPVWHLLAPVVVKNRSGKMVRKVIQKRERE